MPNDHDASTKQAIREAQKQPKTQINNNTNATNVTSINIRKESINNEIMPSQDKRTDKTTSKLRVFSAWSESRSNDMKESLVTSLQPLYYFTAVVVAEHGVWLLKTSCSC